MSTVLAEIDRRILAALMADGRASWRRIAGVLDVSERTVARRGARLLESKLVSIHAVEDPHRSGRGDPYLVYGSASPGRARSVATHLARRPEALTSRTLLGSVDFLSDIWVPEHRRAMLFQQELPDIVGIDTMRSVPVLSYIRSLHDWDPGILTPSENAAMAAPAIGRWPRFNDERMSDSDRQIVALLTSDGRRPFEQLARITGLSEQTIARRVQAMRESGTLALRAVFDPAVIGLPIGTILWLQVTPGKLEEAMRILAELPGLRWAAVTMGQFQIVADLRLATKDHLYELMLDSPWAKYTTAVDASMVLESLKQSDVLTEALH